MYIFNDNLDSKKYNDIRTGCKDIWNAFMTDGTSFGKYDIPFCPTTATNIPKEQLTWEEARTIHRNYINKNDKDYYIDAYINWYIDDYKFDSSRGIWHDYNFTFKVVKHFAGIITPDFSTYQDFPYPIKIYATYRMRTLGYWLGKQGINVINNVRWGTEETFDYCFEGISTHSIVSIGTVGGGPRKLIDRERFETGLFKMAEILKPHTILVYGSSKGSCFDKLKEQGIRIVSFQSRTSKVFEGRKRHE